MLGLSRARWIGMVVAVILVLGFVVPAVFMHFGGGSGPLRTVTYKTP
ncbi:MAG TPA: hypothetical protein VNY33_06025 [Gaiellaceae bacterium]|jgi:hypothetical protein|nr:hypothetical protein [Gaiellaceae bacterium]